MISPNLSRERIPGTAIGIAMLLLLAPATGRCQEEAVEEAAEEVAEEAADAVVGNAAQVNMIHLGQNQADRWVFGDQAVFQNQTGTNRRGAMNQVFGLQLDFIESAITLSEPQRKKLELAGRGDIDRFMDRFDAFAAECPIGAVTQTRYIELSQKAQPLARRYLVGVHGEGSLFRKVLRSMLGTDQLAKLEALETERNRKRYQAIIKATVAMIDQRIPLTAEQRTRLIDLTMSETTPPDAAVEGYYKYHVVLYQMSEIPEARIRPIFGDDEWPAFRAVMQQGQMARGIIMRAGNMDLDE